MSANAIGTLIRIGFIATFVMLFWALLVLVVYLITVFLFNFDFSIGSYFVLFSLLILFRMFYPKNVFK